MGRTLPSITMVYYNELSALSPFRRALRLRDQLALDELYTAAHKHLAEAAYAAHPLPMEIFLLAMLLEEHKVVMGLCERIEELLAVREKGVLLLSVGDIERNNSSECPVTHFPDAGAVT